MPRTYDSDEQRRQGGLLRFSANVDCEDCGAVFEGMWVDDSLDAEQMTDPPVSEQVCPSCGWSDEVEYPGFVNYGDAG